MRVKPPKRQSLFDERKGGRGAIARAIVRARTIRSTLHLAGEVERDAPRTGHRASGDYGQGYGKTEDGHVLP